MTLVVTHTTAADGTFSTAGAAAWNASHTISGTLDLLTQTTGATANRLMYGGASGEVAQSQGMVWDAANSRLTIANSGTGISTGALLVSSISIGIAGISKTNNTLLTVEGYSQPVAAVGDGGGLDMTAGSAGANGGGGLIRIRSGNAAGTTGAQVGGGFDVEAGRSSLTDPDSSGGNMNFLGGGGYGSNGYGGSMFFQAGLSSTSTAPGAIAGDVSFGGGICYGTTGTPGNINFLVGQFSAGGGAVGKLIFGAVLGDPIAVAAGTGTTHADDLPVIVDGVQRYIRLYS